MPASSFAAPSGISKRYGPLQLSEAATEAEALAFFAELKALHCASWERRGRSARILGRVLRDRSTGC